MDLILFIIVLIVIRIFSSKSNRKANRRVSKSRSEYNNNENFIYYDNSNSDNDYTEHHYQDCGEYYDHDCDGSDFGDDCGGGDCDGGSSD